MNAYEYAELDRAREIRIAAMMGREEESRVANAIEHSLQNAAVRTMIRAEALRLVRMERERITEELRAECDQQSVKRAVQAERERCLGICKLFPDNRMAQEIARRISE